MMLPSHLLATLVACALLALARPFARREWLLALAYGVAIDLDHLLQAPAYFATHPVSAWTPAAIMAWGGAWQGFMHTPWALAVVLPTCYLARSLIPAAFWGLHMVQDFVVARHLVGFGSAQEGAIVAALFIALLGLAGLDHARSGRARSFPAHVAARVMLAMPQRRGDVER